MMAGVLIFMTVQRVAQAPKKVEEPVRVSIVVATRDIPLHSVLGAADVELREVPPETVPEDGLADLTEATGKLTTADIARGEVVLRRRLIAPDYVGPRAAFVMDPKQVLIAVAATDLLASLGIVRPGDHIDIMLTFDFGKTNPQIATGMNTLFMMQDVRVAAVVYDGASPEGSGDKPPSGGAGPARALLLALDPQDALLMKYFRDAGASMDYDLRSPAAEGPFDSVPVDNDYLLQRMKIRWRVVQ